MNDYFGIDRLVDFTKFLRSEGFIVGMNETADAIKLISEYKFPGKDNAQKILRSITCSSANDWQRFDELFDRYWFNNYRVEVTPKQPLLPSEKNRVQPPNAITGLAGTSLEMFDSLKENTESPGTGAGRQKTISQADFRFLNDKQAMREAEQMAEDLSRVLIKSGKRKQVIRSKGDKLAIRQTIRSNLHVGGFPINQRHHSIKRIQPHLVILHDVSHSMSWNNPLLFRFVRGLMRTFKDSDAFVFHTELFQVSSLYRERSIQKMRDKLESKNHLWLGGTCIAGSLQTFNQIYARKSLKKNSIIILISDGFDTDTPDTLANELAALKNSSRSILWLNPMLGRQEYTMETETLDAVSPYINQFIPAHSVDSLRKCIHYINCH